MQMRRLFLAVSVGLACVILFGGCYKKRKSGTGADMGDNVGGVMGAGDLYGEGLAGRPGEGAAYGSEGQFQPVYFEYDSSQIGEADRAAADAVANYLQQNAAVGVIIEGNCDERGSNEYNLALGERRALAVRAYLIGMGIDGARIQTKSYGEERPASPGHDEEAWRLNRRADFLLFQ